MNKEQLIKLSGIDPTKVDAALPSVFVAKCYNAGIDPLVIFAGWIHDKHATMGRPLPMSELWAMVDAKRMQTMANALSIIETDVRVKNCTMCNGKGEVETNIFDEPPESCPKCGDFRSVIEELKALQ